MEEFGWIDKQTKEAIKMKVIAIDMDLTLTNEECWTEQECLEATPNQKVIDKIRDICMTHYIVISTARRVELAATTIKWLYKYDVPFNAIDFRKTAADLYVDDKAITPEEFLKTDFTKGLYGREYP